MVEIFGKLVKFEIFGNAFHRPRFRHRLKSAQQDFASVFFVIGTFLWHTQGRKLCQLRHRIRDDVEMFTGMKRHVDAHLAPDLMAPHTSAVHHMVTGDAAFALGTFPVHSCDPAVLLFEP